MARIVFATALITLAAMLAGCQVRGGAREFADPESPTNTQIASGPTESDLVEQMASARQTYQKSLEQLIAFYAMTGENVKLKRTRRELEAIMLFRSGCPSVPPVQYQATTAIPAADELYYEAIAAERSRPRPGGYTEANSNEGLRLTLQKYNRLIRDYPSSDKIDDAAYRAGVIFEELEDYVVALEYFKLVFKWDAETIYPARFRAARILDQRLDRYAEALELYQQAIDIEATFDRHKHWKEFAEQRISEIKRLYHGAGS
ncbi:MAG: tetratricopeptide repeat protein [Planctomycetota bacterium]